MCESWNRIGTGRKETNSNLRGGIDIEMCVYDNIEVGYL